MPGVLGELMWVTASEYDDSEQGGREVDPAPLARLLCAALQISGDLGEEMQAIANDNDDGPVHIVHLLAACEYAARATGGHVMQAAGGDRVTQLLMLTTSVGQTLPLVCKALHDGGYTAATAAVRAMDAGARNNLLDALVHIWTSPIMGLCMDLTEDQLLE